MLLTPETEDSQIQDQVAEAVEQLQKHPFYTAQGWRSTFIQFLRYCIVGGLNTFVDIGVLNILLWRFPTHTVEMLTAYSAIAYCCGAISSFFLNKYWTFRHTHGPTAGELGRYLVTIVLEIIYSSALVWLASRALQPFIANITIWGNASKLVAVVCGAIISYALMRFWTFAHRPMQENR